MDGFTLNVRIIGAQDGVEGKWLGQKNQRRSVATMGVESNLWFVDAYSMSNAYTPSLKNIGNKS